MTATQGRAAAGNGAREGSAAGNTPRGGPAAETPTATGAPTVTGVPTATDDATVTDDATATGDRVRSGDRTADGEPARSDTVAAVVRQWQTVRPDLDTGPMEIIGRVNRCAALLQQAEDAPLRRVGLSRPEFDLLGALRRTGHELTPGELARETFSSGAAVTKRLKQLTERGLVERRGDTRDRRVAHLRLTEAGQELVDGVLPEQLAYESAVLSALDDSSQGELATLLGKLLSRLEGHMRALRV
ncbi:MarR family winged helix-turn-helix transcriptional regulator [Streptomyces humidus]|uniref:MarR family winged helix-turn-helix transcriptional regulator n=1 Tax=Streptomyces humidus TaxID=52259 RepID=UPI003331A98D